MKGRHDNHPAAAGGGSTDVSVLKHDLGNAIHGLLGMTALLGSSSLSAEQRSWLGAIHHSGRQIQSLVQTLDGAAQGSPRLFRPRPQPIDGVELLEQTLRSHLLAARAVGNRLLLRIDPAVPRKWLADARLLRQLLDNLLGNAIKFTRAGVVELEADAPAGGENALRLRVRDEGEGIGIAEGQRIFRAYRQGAAGQALAGEGRGLGLFICRTVTDAMGGRLDWRQRSAGGTCFEAVLPGLLTLPPAPPAQPALLARIPCRLAMTGRLRAVAASVLTRLGADWSDASDDAPAGGAGPFIRIGAGPAAGAGSAEEFVLELSLQTAEGACIRRRHTGPVFESTLGPLLLELLLEWSLRRRAVADSGRGRSRSERPGCAGRRPA
jgi:anti-sigma regulatory factor (Ser/Thr protein kinase)